MHFITNWENSIFSPHKTGFKTWEIKHKFLGQSYGTLVEFGSLWKQHEHTSKDLFYGLQKIKKIIIS